jgi:outer membrane receptor protein involved in Fe transport
MSRPRRAVMAALSLSAALAFLPAPTYAQQACAQPAVQAWPAPLDRRIAVRARGVSLREALDRIAAAAGFRLSYSSEFLPLDQKACIWSDSVAAGDALASVLGGAAVAPIVAAADYVIIAPTRPAARAPRESVQTLDRVVVTGSATGNAQRALSVAVDVVDRRQIDQQSSGALSSSFDGNVAGMWMWEQGPSSLLARYGSIRGASSFGISYPKVYIDGIEVANPLLTDLNPATVERVEVIRGPQGAALYGADAISGVVNIVTRHDGLQPGDSRVELLSRAGVSQTAFGDRGVLAQNHSLNWRTGSNVRSGSLGMNVSTLGGYVPDAYSRDIKLNGAFRVVTSSASISGIGRVFGKRAAPGQNPLILNFLAPTSAGRNTRTLRLAYATEEDSLADLAMRDSLPQAVSQYTFGVTSTLLSGTTWVPTFSAGIDGYRLSHVPNDLGIVPSALDSALHSSEGGADRVSFRTSLVGMYDVGPRSALTITVSAEHSYLQETLTQPAPVGLRLPDSVTTRSNTGLVTQANLSLNEAWYLTAGARVETNYGFTTDEQAVLLPMLGASYVRDIGTTTIKLRGAYGVGVRPARSSPRGFVLGDARNFGPAPSSLDPERQSGLEVGADITFARRFGLNVTRFDQRASGLIQPVGIPRDSTSPSKQLVYVLQNVGEIVNRGWELESSLELGPVSLGGTFTSVQNRVERIARGYTGELQVGDRMLAVPARTASLTASGDFYGWRTAVTATRAFDWMNYDRMRLAQTYASCDTCTALSISGEELRGYWMQYDGVTRLRASASREFRRGLGVRVTADNITNAQRGEPDNLTVLPGRTVLLGLSAKIR